MQFHFATILSPWIRRALIAGGFGVRDSGETNYVHEEIAPVTRYHDQYIADPEHTKLERDMIARTADLEAGTSSTSTNARSSSDGTIQSLPDEPTWIVPPETPFFHLDLESAVKAAERNLSPASSIIDAGFVKGVRND